MARLPTSEASVRVRDTLQELAEDLRVRGFQVEAGARGCEDIMWARRGELTTAVLVTDRAPRSVEDLTLRISLGDWAEGHRDREFIFVRCVLEGQSPLLQMPAKRNLEQLLAVAANLANGILRALRCSLLGPHR